MDFVRVASSFPSLRQVARLLQVIHDLGRRSFRDPDGCSDVSETDAGVGGEDLKHVGVVRYESEKMV